MNRFLLISFCVMASFFDVINVCASSWNPMSDLFVGKIIGRSISRACDSLPEPNCRLDDYREKGTSYERPDKKELVDSCFLLPYISIVCPGHDSVYYNKDVNLGDEKIFHENALSKMYQYAQQDWNTTVKEPLEGEQLHAKVYRFNEKIYDRNGKELDPNQYFHVASSIVIYAVSRHNHLNILHASGDYKEKNAIIDDIINYVRSHQSISRVNVLINNEESKSSYDSVHMALRERGFKQIIATRDRIIMSK